MFRKRFSEQEKIYINILKGHRKNIKQAFELLQDNFSELFANISKKELKQLRKQIKNHDLSKFSSEEFEAYSMHFCGEDKTEISKNNYEMALLHHHHNNPHHFQYWLLNDNDGQSKALDIPLNYFIEMICDWWSFSIEKRNLSYINNWYESYKDKIVLSEKTKSIVEDILIKIKDKFKTNE